MKHLFVSYDIALRLKEKGFDEPCLAFYSHNNDEDRTMYTYSSHFFIESMSVHRNSFGHPYQISAPLYQQVTDWFRDKHKIHIDINHFTGDSPDEIYWDYSISKLGTELDENGNWVPLIDFHVNRDFNYYYDALNKAIEETLKLI